MGQNSRSNIHFERLLLVCGEPNAGKSRLIRYMFQDLGLGGRVPLNGPLPPFSLSRERCLSGRVTSPHEADESQTDFHRKIEEARANAATLFRRINYVTAVQPRARNRMPGIVDVCEALRSAFDPERIRVVQLAPGQDGKITSRLNELEIDGLRALDVEVVAVDARGSGHPAEPGNIRILADFFDFS